MTWTSAYSSKLGYSIWWMKNRYPTVIYALPQRDDTGIPQKSINGYFFKEAKLYQPKSHNGLLAIAGTVSRKPSEALWNTSLFFKLPFIPAPNGAVPSYLLPPLGNTFSASNLLEGARKIPPLPKMIQY